MLEWCKAVGQNCAFGLITYDLSNAAMGCKDVGDVGKGALDAKVESVWIWSGGIVNKDWEPGLRRYVSGAVGTIPDCSAKSTQAPSTSTSANTNTFIHILFIPI